MSEVQVREIQLGQHVIPVTAQRWKKITKRLGKVLDAFRGAVDESGEFDGQKFVGLLGERTYYTLVTFIPDLYGRMPEYEFAGYGTREAYDSDDYNEELDQSPSFPQLIEAFDVIVEVNGGKRFVQMLGKVLDPTMLKAEASLALSEWRERSTGSPSSPGASTESPPTSSTPSATTSAAPSASETDELGDGFEPRPFAGKLRSVAA